jgi:heme-degrading monooxygenase HmoA
MTSSKVIVLRVWTARIRTEHEAEYGDYIARTGGDDLHKTSGNLGHQVIVRSLGDGTSEISALSWWIDMDAVKAFAGEQPEVARYYPEDDAYLLERPQFVVHHRVLSGSVHVPA